ncbi:MAG TPA: protein kinase [Longimicrobiales bacterium]|nr:protein kinase [Longimicrobiales bacterium]
MTEGHTERLVAALGGKYRIERKLGEGGMASVYLAQDLKHERSVALKVLKPELAAVLGAERFLSEIKTTANLQHPHILPLFDSGSADGYLYYVMPFIDGETLREKLDRERQLGVEEAVRITRDVSDALDYAHRHGVIHRDIKPGNILLHDGRPVVADFGIALAVSAAGGGRMTETGLSLGTPHYMSPEQAGADRDLSARSDVYSLGCVLYEMLAGQPPHTGPSAQSILVRILTETPRPLTELRHTVPTHVASAVAKAIEKLPADRFEGAKAFRDALEDPGFTYQTRPPTDAFRGMTTLAPSPPSPPRRTPVHAAATALLGLTTLLFGWMAVRDAPAQVERGGLVSFVLTEDLHPFFPPIVGSDGSIAFYAPSNEGLNLLAPGSLAPVFLEGTEDAPLGAFSPDGEWLAFVEEFGQGGYALRRMPARGGPVSTLWESPTAREIFAPFVSWSDDGWIYVGEERLVGRVPEEGGPLDTVFAMGEPPPVIARLAALPGGAGLLLTLVFSNTSTDNRVVLLDLATGDTAMIVRDGFDAQWVSSGQLVYAHSGGALYALPFDARRLQATGPPVPVVDDVAVFQNVGGRFSVSPNGILAYARGSSAGLNALYSFALVSPTGGVERLRLDPTDHQDAALSPDGSRLAYTRDGHIWIYDLDRGTNRQLTEEGENHHNPIWSPDGSEVVFTATRPETIGGELYVRRADGADSARHVGGRPENPDDFATQWLEDGTILFDGQGTPDIYRVSGTGERPAEAVLQADWVEMAPKVSPDGQWFAYMSNEDGGVPHLFMRRWPDLSGKTQLTSGETGISAGDNGLVWAADSRTLHFLRERRLWTATLTGSGPASFELRDTGVDMPGPLWDRHPDGRLLVHVTADDESGAGDDAQTPQLVVVANWIRALEERLGAGRGR